MATHLTIGDRGFVTFTEGGRPFHVSLPKAATPKNFAGVMAVVYPREKWVLPPIPHGELAADFISAIAPHTRPKLVHDFSLANCDFYYVVERLTFATHSTFTVYPVKDGKSLPTALFRGDLVGLKAWAENYSAVEGLVHKVVQFQYDGGSSPGAIRTIRVEKVGRDAAGMVCLEGIDLAKPDLTEGAYRKYTSAKIVGEVKILN